MSKRIDSKDPLKIYERCDTVCLEDFEGPIDDVIAILQGIKEKHSNRYSNINLEPDDDYWGSGIAEFAVIGTRLETTGEVEVRLKAYRKEKKRKEEDKRRRERAERKTYERLKKKFEGK